MTGKVGDIVQSQCPTIIPGSLRIAVLIPCYNEAGAIGKVVKDFRGALPQATVYVYDNNSTDGSVAEAEATGALVRREPRQGKGFVVRRMLADIELQMPTAEESARHRERAAGTASKLRNRHPWPSGGQAHAVSGYPQRRGTDRVAGVR